MPKYKPELRVRVDTGEDVIDVTSYLVQADGLLSIRPETNNANVKFAHNIFNAIPDLGTKDRIIIEVRYEDEIDYTCLFDGYLQIVNNALVAEQVDTRSEDYTKFVLDRIGTNSYENKTVVEIMRLILNEFFPDFYHDTTTLPDQPVGEEITLDVYSFEDKTLFEVFEYLSSLIGRDFWVSPNLTTDTPEFYCKVRQFDTTVKETLEVGVNITDLIAIEDKTQMWNHIIVEGDRRQFETYETFVGTGAAEYSLTFKPQDVEITVDGVLKKGGLEGVSLAPDYTVDFLGKKIIFTAGNEPAVSAAVVIRYSYDVPIKVEVEDGSSILTYGRREKVWKDTNIKTKTEAIKYAKELRASFGKPIGMAECSHPGSTAFTAGDTVKLLDTNKGYEADLQVVEITWSYNRGRGYTQKIKCTSSRATGTDSLKEIVRRLKQIEEQLKGQVEIVTKLQTIDESIIIRTKRITCRATTVPDGFLWSTKGARWTGDNDSGTTGAAPNTEWGLQTGTVTTVCYDIGDIEEILEDTLGFIEELTIQVEVDPNLASTLIWSGINNVGWSQTGWSGNP